VGTPRLNRIRIAVLMRDGATFDVTTQTVDMTAYDRHRAAAGWPPVADAPLLAFSYYAWHHLTRSTNQLPAMTFAEFERAVDWVEAASDADEADAVDPTNPVAVPE
jgi:hypothetical protein